MAEKIRMVITKTIKKFEKNVPIWDGSLGYRITWAYGLPNDTIERAIKRQRIEWSTDGASKIWELQKRDQFGRKEDVLIKESPPYKDRRLNWLVRRFKEIFLPWRIWWYYHRNVSGEEI